MWPLESTVKIVDSLEEFPATLIRLQPTRHVCAVGDRSGASPNFTALARRRLPETRTVGRLAEYGAPRPCSESQRPAIQGPRQGPRFCRADHVRTVVQSG